MKNVESYPLHHEELKYNKISKNEQNNDKN